MTTHVSRKQQSVMKSLPAEPSLLITMPFEPKISGESQLQEQVRFVVKKAEKILETQYSGTELRQVTERLNMLFKKLNFHCFTKSVAALISPSSHKIIYLDMRLREAINVNSSFQITDLLELKEQPVQYLVLVLNERWAKTFYGNQSGFKLIKTDRPKPFPDVKQMGSYSLECRRKALPGSLYRQIADDFTLITRAYSLPVFLVGSVRNVSYFNHVVASAKDIVQVIYSNTDNISERLVFHKLKPYFFKWNNIKYRYLRRQLQEADRNGGVIWGKSNLMRDLEQADGKLLMMEESCLHADDATQVHVINSSGDIVPQTCINGNNLQRMIETFLENGGEVEVLPDGFLKDYEKIALITCSAHPMLNYQVSQQPDYNETF